MSSSKGLLTTSSKSWESAKQSKRAHRRHATPQKADAQLLSEINARIVEASLSIMERKR